MLEFEETLQDRLNAAGVLATQEGLRQFDTDGSPITVGSVTFTSKGQHPKDYQTPYWHGHRRTTCLPESAGRGHLLPVGS